MFFDIGKACGEEGLAELARYREWQPFVYAVSERVHTTKFNKHLGISRNRTIQFPNLVRIPADLRSRHKGKGDLTESKLGSIVQLDPIRMRDVPLAAEKCSCKGKRLSTGPERGILGRQANSVI